MTASVQDYFIRAGDQVPTIDQVHEYLESTYKPDKAKKRPGTINGFLEQWLEKITKGDRLTPKGKRYEENTIKAVRTFRIRIEEYQTKKKKVLNWKQIDQSFYDSYTSYLATTHDNNPASIGKYVKILKTFMKAAQDEGLHENEAYKKFKVTKLESQATYLNKVDMKNLEDFDLSGEPHLERIRDLFLIGCYTAQRISDYKRISRDNLKITNQGTETIELIQQKENVKVIIPIKPELKDLLIKYNYKLPEGTEQHLNREIKIIAKRAGIDEPIQVTKFKNGVRYEITKPKYEFISSHTARRTAVTLMLSDGIPVHQIQKITGHKKLETLLGYNRTTKEETADTLAKHRYFTSSLKVV